MPKKEQQLFYVSPTVKTIEINTTVIICQSGGNGGNKGMEEVDYGDGGFTIIV